VPPRLRLERPPRRHEHGRDHAQVEHQGRTRIRSVLSLGHRAILAAVVRGDAEEARDTMFQHLSDVGRLTRDEAEEVQR
jgi:DNA-binding FadR family transcriptional regulator